MQSECASSASREAIADLGLGTSEFVLFSSSAKSLVEAQPFAPRALELAETSQWRI